MDWLLSVLQKLFDLLPRPHIVTPDQERVVFRFGRWKVVKKAGWYIEWPIFCGFETVQVSEEPLNGFVVIDGIKKCWTARYRVIDPIKSVTVTTNSESTTVAAIDGCLVQNNGEVNLDEINETVGQWGCEVLDIKLTSTGIRTVDIYGGYRVREE